jgi:hypothetical protein
MTYAISPHFVNEDFPADLSTDQKVEVFADRVRGWQIDIAKLCAASSPHSGFAVLSILFSYFEMIAKYQAGYAESGQSEVFFGRGFLDVFRIHPDPPPDVKKQLIRKLYRDVRCGLYHNGLTGHGIALSGDLSDPIAYVPPDGIMINPHLLVPGVEKHFLGYIRRLRDSRNVDLRLNFEKRFVMPGNQN